MKVQYWFSLFWGKYGHQTKGSKLDNFDVHGEEEDANNTSNIGNDKQSKVAAQHSNRQDEFEVSFLFLCALVLREPSLLSRIHKILECIYFSIIGEMRITHMKEMEEEKEGDEDEGNLVGVGSIMVMGVAI